VRRWRAIDTCHQPRPNAERSTDVRGNDPCDEAERGPAQTVLADAGFASGEAVAALKEQGIEPLVAIARTQPHRPYDFRPPPEPKKERHINEPWRIAMKSALESAEGKARYKKRKQTVEPVFGIVKSAMGFLRFSLRGLEKVKLEWTLISLAYNCRRMATLKAAIA